MRAVLDSNVALKSVLAEPDTPKATQLCDEFQRGMHQLLAPDVFEVEIAHALTRAERQGRIAVGQALALWSGIMANPPALQPSSSLMPRAIEISSVMRAGLYDCLFVALAEREACELITADDKMLKRLQPTFPFVVPLSSLP
jgi:predicted nucleic acid-binding protein